ncbi:NAD(P)H-binding protein [Kitasatospora sp. NPDC097691]|uniref:NAD(P)H-binding protein n=1 Tax=Kitasatospora sp. NPDC097691 TaxID=3157231 RepID=UPI00332FB330
MNTTLVLGGTGKTGSRVARLLEASGLPVRTASRTGDGPRFDLADPATWPRALDGATAAYVVEPAPSANTDHQARIPRLVSEAVAAGVRRLVLLSAPRAGEADHPLHAAEQAVRGCGVGWTVLRPQWFAQNFSEGPWRRDVLDGTLALPTGEGRTPFIDAEDIAEVAVAALTDDRHSGRTYDLTGPEAITFGEAAGHIARATGRTVRHVDVDPEHFVAQQVSAGVSPDAARFLTALLVDVRHGGNTAIGDGVEQALGRAPRPFETFAAAAAAAGHWS